MRFRRAEVHRESGDGAILPMFQRISDGERFAIEKVAFQVQVLEE